MKNFLARRPVQIAFVLILLLLVGIFLLGQWRLAERFAFQQNQNKWTSQNISTYSFDVEAICFCPYREPIHVEVRNGAPTTKNEIEINSVNDLFQIVHDANETADAVSAAYDAQYGFPSYIAIDYIRQAVDDEVSYRVTNFQILR